MTTIADKTLICRECNKEFTFTSGEQEFFNLKGLQNEPARCPDCRQQRRKRKPQDIEPKRRDFTTVKCAECGQDTEIPFKPTQGRPVYCNNCYRSKKRDNF